MLFCIRCINKYKHEYKIIGNITDIYKCKSLCDFKLIKPDFKNTQDILINDLKKLTNIKNKETDCAEHFIDNNYNNDNNKNNNYNIIDFEKLLLNNYCDINHKYDVNISTLYKDFKDS